MGAKYLSGFNGLRFLAITSVVLHHLFTFKSSFGFTRFDASITGRIVVYGIQFFFAGSAFLITYLLLVERAANRKIQLHHFIMRRILRIWPAYYLLLFLALLVVLKLPFFNIPGITDAYLRADYRTSNFLCFLFLPHLQPFFFPTAPYVHPTYTIGIEEQFYVVWGLLFFFAKRRLYLFFIALAIAGPLLSVLHYFLHLTYGKDPSYSFVSIIKSAITYFNYSRFSTFAIGSLFAYAYFQNQRWISAFRRRDVQLIVYVVLVASISFGFQPSLFYNEYFAVIVSCIMLMATFKMESIVNYSANWINYLGKISYGIYLFHIFAIVLACKLVKSISITETSFFVTLLLCMITMGFSILFGAISFHYFESFFLRLKKYFRTSAKVDTVKQSVEQQTAPW